MLLGDSSLMQTLSATPHLAQIYGHPLTKFWLNHKDQGDSIPQGGCFKRKTVISVINNNIFI